MMGDCDTVARCSNAEVQLDEHARRRTAYHEAGHAVIFLSGGWPVRHVTIHPDERYAGSVTTFGIRDAKPTSHVTTIHFTNTYISGHVAGPIAEAMFEVLEQQAEPTVESVLDLFKTWALPTDDVMECIDVARSICFSIKEADHHIYTCAYRVAGAFLKQPKLWTAVEGLAQGLLDHGELSGIHAEWLVVKALSGRPCRRLRSRLASRIARDAAELTKKHYRPCAGYGF